MSQRFWIGVASRDHLGRNIAGGQTRSRQGHALPAARQPDLFDDGCRAYHQPDIQQE